MQIETSFRLARGLSVLFIVGTAVSCAALGGARGPDPATVTFADVQPILEKYCVECHSGDEPKEELLLTDYDSVMKGSHHGPVVVPSDPGSSTLFDLVESGKMPMGKQTPKPSADEIAVLRAWIEGGARA